jgi:hypothetical protein
MCSKSSVELTYSVHIWHVGDKHITKVGGIGRRLLKCML